MSVFKVFSLIGIVYSSILLCNSSDKKQENKNFTVIIGNYSNNDTIMPLLIRYLNNDTLLGINGELFTFDELKSFNSKFLINGKVINQLKFENEKNTSIKDLKRVIDKLKEISDPKIETIIYISIQGK